MIIPRTLDSTQVQSFTPLPDFNFAGSELFELGISSLYFTKPAVICRAIGIVPVNLDSEGNTIAAYKKLISSSSVKPGEQLTITNEARQDARKKGWISNDGFGSLTDEPNVYFDKTSCLKIVKEIFDIKYEKYDKALVGTPYNKLFELQKL